MLKPTALLPWEIATYAQLDWIPQAVRFKLDGVGAKVGLKQWQDLTFEHRNVLVLLPAETAPEQALWLQKLLEFLKEDKAGEAQKMTPLTHPREFKVDIQDQWRAVGFSVTPEIWSTWNEFERFLAEKTAFSKSSQVPLKEIAPHLGLTPL